MYVYCIHNRRSLAIGAMHAVYVDVHVVCLCVHVRVPYTYLRMYAYGTCTYVYMYAYMQGTPGSRVPPLRCQLRRDDFLPTAGDR